MRFDSASSGEKTDIDNDKNGNDGVGNIPSSSILIQLHAIYILSFIISPFSI